MEVYGDNRDLPVLSHSFPTRRSSDLPSGSQRRFGSVSVSRVSAYSTPARAACSATPPRLSVRPCSFSICAVSANVPTTAASSMVRSEEHTSELQSLMRSSYAVFCLKKKPTRQASHGHPYTCEHARQPPQTT